MGDGRVRSKAAAKVLKEAMTLEAFSFFLSDYMSFSDKSILFDNMFRCCYGSECTKLCLINDQYTIVIIINAVYFK